MAANAGKELILYDLAHAANEHGVRLEDLRKVLQRYETNNNLLGKESALALYGGEHLTAEGAEMLKKRKVIIIANDSYTRDEEMD